MPEFGPPIAEFRQGDLVSHVPLYVQEAVARNKKDGGVYANYQFRDRSGWIAGVNWDGPPAEDEQTAVALVTGRVGAYRGQPQLAVQKVLVLANPDPTVIARLRPPADAARQATLLSVMEGARQQLPPTLWALFREALGHDPFELDGPFWTWAAAEKMHHADPGGLAWHVLTMYSHVELLAPTYPNLDADLLRLAVLCHDLGKIDCYEMGLVAATQRSLDRTVGHTTYGMMRVSAAIAKLRGLGHAVSVADEENLLHCIAAHHGRREWGAVAEPQTPEAAALHALDLIDARLRTTDQRTEGPPRRGSLPPGDEAPLARTLRAPRERPGQPSLFDG